MNTYLSYEAAQEIYMEEKDRLKKKLSTARAYHIGSTAVPNLKGSGVIDVLFFYDHGEKDKTIATILKLKYKEQNDLPYFRYENKEDETVFHLHLYEKGSKVTHMYFKDMLKDNEEIKKEYADFLQVLRTETGSDQIAYYKNKKDFIAKAFAKSLQ